MNIFNEYISSLKSIPINEITEYSHRGDLEKLLNYLAKQQNPKIQILHEPKRKKGYGSPDFRVSLAENIIGYVENKNIDENLDKFLKSEQIQRYLSLTDNLIITNYLEWIWIKNGKIIRREHLCYISDLENKKFKFDKYKIELIEYIIKNFFTQPPEGISDTKRLAKVLAVRAKYLKEFLEDELQRQENEDQTGKLCGLFQTFHDYIFKELTIADFADTFSQNLVYGLFLARLSTENKTINLYNAKRNIPQSFELLRELVNFFDELDKEEYQPIKWIVEEVLTILNNLDLLKIHESLSFLKLKKDEDGLVIKDPYVYFYEDFLTAYDKNIRETRGVYYTPPPIVSFIIRSINTILQNKFGIKNGFADHHRVTVLDFATGTGTFLVQVFEQIFEKLPKGSGKRKLIIKEHILKNIYGFEYLIAPYTIAHLKLLQYLKDKGYELQAKERLQIYLTNTLEPADPQLKIPLLPALTEETQSAQRVKDNPILVITGNPPYSGHSKNPSEIIKNVFKNGKKVKIKEKTAIGRLIETYFYIDGKRLKERNPKNLQDDYVKFIRFAQWKMQEVEQGVIGVITNHSYLDNPTFRGMRQSLLQTFNQVYILDLHGNTKKREISPDGSKDENVFDIQQGVSISFFIKKKELPKKVFHADMYGLRIKKYKQCLESDIVDLKWQEIKPQPPFYLFIPQDIKLKIKYDKYLSIIDDIFKVSTSGIKTHNDKILVDFYESNLLNKVRNYYRIKCEKNKVKDYHYRPFDIRKIYYDTNIVGRAREKTIKHLNYENVGLILVRQAQVIGSNIFDSAFVINSLVDTNLFRRGGPLTFPLYLYEEDKDMFNTQKSNKTENLKERFRHFVDNYYGKRYTPEEILGYIYAILFSNTYREKYADFLKIDFPRIPFSRNNTIFDALSKLGQELIDAYLMQKIPNYNNGVFIGIGSYEVEDVRFIDKKGLKRLYINEIQYFDKIPREVYEFTIGGYQVLDKYLKYRKGGKLALDEINNVEKIVKIIIFTINKMNEIEKLTNAWI